MLENKRLIHEYLGIVIDYSIPGKVVTSMFDYLEDVIVEAVKDLRNSRLYYPGNDQLFKVDCGSPSLPSKDAELFHRHVVRGCANPPVLGSYLDQKENQCLQKNNSKINQCSHY